MFNALGSIMRLHRVRGVLILQLYPIRFELVERRVRVRRVGEDGGGRRDVADSVSAVSEVA